MNLEIVEKEKITVVFDRTASHNVDPQIGFTPLSPLELPVPGGDTIVEELNRQNSLVKYKTVSKDVHPNNAIWIAKKKPQGSPIKGDNVDVTWNAHCITGTFGVELLPGLPLMKEYDFFLAKGFEPDFHPYSSCYHDLAKKISTGLIEWYESRNVCTVIVGGLATDYCVAETCKDLATAGFQVILNLKSCRGIGTPEAVYKCVYDLSNEYDVIVIGSTEELEVVTEI